MIKKRLIPKLLIKRKKIGPREINVLVTTKNYTTFKEIGNPVSQAKIYEAQMADELIVLNIDGNKISNDSSMQELIERLATETFMPLCIGGGVSSIEDFDLLLSLGADKVSVNSSAIENPQLIYEAARVFGAQCVVLSVDFSYNVATGRTKVFKNNGKVPTDFDVIEWVKKAVDLGAGEILLSDIDRDGTGLGLNTKIASEVVDLVPVPVILSGGCGLADHFVQGFKEANVEAVAAGTFFSLRDQNPIQTRAHIKNAGIPIRLET